MTRKFTNTKADGEVTGSNPDAIADFYYITDRNRDDDYWHSKLVQALTALASDPTQSFYIIEGGEVTDAGSGKVNIARGTGIGKDANSAIRLVEIPALTNVTLPSGWTNNRQIWLKGEYAYALSSETRLHRNGESYHYVLKDSYTGETSTDDLFTDSDPSATSLVFDSFKMNGTTFTSIPSGRSPKLNHLHVPRGLLIGGAELNGNNPPTLKPGLYDVKGELVRVNSAITSSFAANSLGDTAIANNYWYLLLVDKYSRVRTHIAWGDQFLGTTAIQSIASSGGGIFEIRVLNAVDLSSFSIGMVMVVTGATATANDGVYESTAFSNTNDSGGAGFKYIRIRNSSGAVQASSGGSFKASYRIKNITTAGSTNIYSPAPTFDDASNHFLSDYDSDFRPVAAYRADGSGVVTDLIEYGSGDETNDDVFEADTFDSYGGTDTKIWKFTNIRKMWGRNYTVTDSSANGTFLTVNKFGDAHITYIADTDGTENWVGISLNSSQLTTGLMSINVTDRKSTQHIIGGGSNAQSGAATIKCSTGSDEIRVHADAAKNLSTPANAYFGMVLKRKG